LPLRELIWRLLIGILFCLVATFGFAWLARSIFADRFVTFDDSVITWLHGFWGPLPDQVMLALTTLGEALWLGIIIGVAAILAWRARLWVEAVGLVVAAVGAGLILQGLKLFFQRARPSLFPGLFKLTSYSFPSGHALGSLVCYGILAYVLLRFIQRRWVKIALIAATVLLVLGIGLSRVYLGVHYPTDILGGYIAGAIWLTIVIGAVRTAGWYVLWRADLAPGYPQGVP
jgi:undecaprenyl-diphosphatase